MSQNVHFHQPSGQAAPATPRANHLRCVEPAVVEALRTPPRHDEQRWRVHAKERRFA